jgi:beta-xylosidase
MNIRMLAQRGLWLVMSLGLVSMGSGAAQAAPVSPSAPSGAPFFDGFDTTPLEAGWSWVREDNTAWSLTERPGFLRIRTQPGTLDDSSLANNILRRAAPGSDYEVSTRVEVAVTQDFHEAGLLLYKSDFNFIKISRIFDAAHGGSVFLLRREVGGMGVGSFFSPAISTSVAELRLRFVAPYVSGAYKDGSGNWVELGSYNVGPLSTYTHVALAAHHGFPDLLPTSITADFDFLQIAPLSALYLPLVGR